ncbi:MAG TPA: glycosyltransferase family 4 protein [Gemmatimonadales bacterium]|nr:glycosyltransferase family 4 protein [Gemmatimonadales bacterium]
MTRPLRIAVVAACPFPERRGTPVRIQRIAEGIQRRGHQVHVVTYPYGSGELDEPVTLHRVRPAGTSYRAAPGPSISKLLVIDPLLVLMLRQVLREQQIDVIHAHHYEGLLAGAAARTGTGIPLIYDAHTLLESELPSYGRAIPGGAKRAFGALLDRKLPPLADHVISVTDRIRDTLLARTRFRPEQVSSISNGVECDLFDRHVAAERDPARPPIIVFTGNLAAYQGVDLLLKAFQTVRASRPDVRLRIVTQSGFAEYEPAARLLGIRDGIDLVDTGFENVPALLAESDIAVNPRPGCDGIPLKLLNYMAAARPVVSFEGSAPGVEHGQTGWLVPRGDASAFALGILTLLAAPDQAREIGRQARRYVEEHHSWDAVAERTERVYRELAGHRPTPRGTARIITEMPGASSESALGAGAG